MPNTTAAATSTASGEVSGMFDQAFRALEDSLKVASKAQEDVAKFWNEATGRGNPGQEVAGEWIQTAQKDAAEYFQLLESSYRRNSALAKKVIDTQNGNNGNGLEKRTRDWMQDSIAVARDTAQNLASGNLRIAQAWTEALKMGTQQGAHWAQENAEKGADFAHQAVAQGARRKAAKSRRSPSLRPPHQAVAQGAPIKAAAKK